MKALRSVLRAPRLIAFVVVLQLAVALFLGTGVGDVARSSLGSYSPAPEDHLQGVISELFAAHPGLAVNIRQALALSSGFAMALWTLLAAVIILRLRAPTPATRLLPAALRHIPAVIATTAWSLLPRAVLLGLAGAATAKLMGHGVWGLAGLAMMLAVLGYCACALDLARCGVVLHGARRFHPMTAFGGYLQAARRPRVLIPSMLASLGQGTCVAGMLAGAIHGLGDGVTIWWIRGLSVLAVFLGLVRVSVAVQAGPYRSTRPDPG